jgi:hypothetical protein
LEADRSELDGINLSPFHGDFSPLGGAEHRCGPGNLPLMVSGPGAPRHKHLGIRRRPFGNYLIFYRIGPDAIEVVHVLHGARDYEPLLFPES